MIVDPDAIQIALDHLPQGLTGDGILDSNLGIVAQSDHHPIAFFLVVQAAFGQCAEDCGDPGMIHIHQGFNQRRLFGEIGFAELHQESPQRVVIGGADG